MVNGDPENVYNVVLVRGNPCFLQGDPIRNRINANAFARLAASYVASSFVEDGLEENRRRLNMYRGEPGGCIGQTLPDTTPFSGMDSIGFASDTLGGDTTNGNRTFRFDFGDIGTYRHESAHSMFNLADEYSCISDAGTVRLQPPLHGNLFVDRDTCARLSVDPAACRELLGSPNSCTPVGSWSKADRDDDIMVGGSRESFGPLRRRL